MAKINKFNDIVTIEGKKYFFVPEMYPDDTCKGCAFFDIDSSCKRPQYDDNDCLQPGDLGIFIEKPLEKGYKKKLNI